MPLADVFKAVRIIEPDAYLVWQALVDTFPKGYFAALMRSFADQESSEGDGYDLLKMCEYGLKRIRAAQDEIINEMRHHIHELQNRNIELIDQTAHERDLNNSEMLRLQKVHAIMMNEFIAEVNRRSNYELEQRTDQLEREIKLKDELIRKLDD
jgi:hypothetical protein